jgi:uncharacterized protein (TIGR03382 family)
LGRTVTNATAQTTIVLAAMALLAWVWWLRRRH